MSRVGMVGVVALYIYAGDHNPPHFHARAAGLEVQIALETLTVMRGSLPASQLAAVVAWARENHDALRAAWARLNPGR